MHAPGAAPTDTFPASSFPWADAPVPVTGLVRARTRNGTISLARLRHDGQGERVLRARKQDAQLAIFQIGLPSLHHFTEGPGPMRQIEGVPNAMNFADLGEAPGCRIVGPLDSLHLHIPRAAMDDLADEADAPRIEALRTRDGWRTRDPIVDGLRQVLLTALDQPDQVSQLLADHLLLGLSAHLAQRYGGLRAAPRSGGLAPWQARRARALIEGDLAGRLSVAEIARECGLSPAHFARAFKVSTGLTPHAYLQGCRVARARAMLAQRDLPLADIAQECGFADQSHFTRVFARQSGATPGQWRRVQAI